MQVGLIGADAGPASYPELLDGIIEDDPLFVDQEFHLEPDSPAIDTGDPESDYCFEPQANGGRVNMGAYGNTPDATAHPDAIQGECGE